MGSLPTQATPARLREVFNLENQTQTVKQNEERDTFQMKKNTTKTLEKDFNNMQISNLPNKELKVMVIKMLTQLRRRIDEHSENFNRETIR